MRGSAAIAPSLETTLFAPGEVLINSELAGRQALAHPDEVSVGEAVGFGKHVGVFNSLAAVERAPHGVLHAEIGARVRAILGRPVPRI
eukprot:scaffold4485_cov135-Isochrysis_galbana.AAC.9